MRNPHDNQNLQEIPEVKTEPTTAVDKIITYLITAVFTLLFLALFIVLAWPLLKRLAK